MHKILDAGIRNLHEAKEKFQEPGDIRELLKMKKQPAEKMFGALIDISSSVVCR